jgi:two-component system, OmpR family, alkaline phosphatase synthesis response regulator PhoP
MANDRYRLLIVDDEPDIRELLSYNFKKQGFDVDTAIHGLDALDKISENIPDIIILDLMMPFRNGISICREIRQKEELQHIPIYFLTATSNSELLLQAAESGACEVLNKPIQMSLLVRKISNRTISEFRNNRQKNKTDFVDGLIEPGDTVEEF